MTDTLLIFEPSFSGHHLYYVRLIALEAVRQGWRCVLATSPDFPVEGAGRDALAGVPLTVVHLVARGRTTTITDIRRIQQAVGANAVVVPNADQLVLSLALWSRRRHSVPLVGLVMRDPFDVPARSIRDYCVLNVKRWAIRRARRVRGASILRLGPALPIATAEGLVADPVLVSDTAELDPAELDSARFWFVMVGAIGPWKNPLMVLEAFERASLVDEAGIAVVGRIDDMIREEVVAEVERLSAFMPVKWVDRVLSNAEFNAVVRRADAVVMAYSTHAPNSTAAKAAVFGTAVVAAGSERYLANVARVVPHAIRCQLDPESLAQAMRCAVNTPRPIAATGFPPPENFGAAFLREIQRMTNER